MKKIIVISILAVVLLSVSFTSISALTPENEQKLNDKIKSLEKKIKELLVENTKLKTENTKLKTDIVKLKTENSQPKQNPTTPKTSVISEKLFSLLPQKEDLSSEWKITKSGDYNKSTKSFYYENAGQVNYDKNVNTIKEYRMNIFKFSSSKSVQEAYDKQNILLKSRVGHWLPKDGSNPNDWIVEKGEFELLFPDVKSLLMNSQNCVAIKEPADYGDYDHLAGYCLANNYIIYQDVTGYYPDMKNDFIKMMNIAKSKVS